MVLPTESLVFLFCLQHNFGCLLKTLLAFLCRCHGSFYGLQHRSDSSMSFADVWFAWCWPHLLRLLWLSFVQIAQFLTGAELAAGLEISARVPGCSADYADSERSNRIKQQLQKENLKMWRCRRLLRRRFSFCITTSFTFTLHIAPDLIRLPFSIFFLLNPVHNLDVRLEEHQWTCIALRHYVNILRQSVDICWWLYFKHSDTFCMQFSSDSLTLLANSSIYFNMWSCTSQTSRECCPSLRPVWSRCSILCISASRIRCFPEAGKLSPKRLPEIRDRALKVGSRALVLVGRGQTISFHKAIRHKSGPIFWTSHFRKFVPCHQTAAYKFTFNPLQTRTIFWRCLKNYLNVV